MSTKRCTNCGCPLHQDAFDPGSDMCRGCVADPGAIDRICAAMVVRLETDR